MAKMTFALRATIQKYLEQGKVYREIASLTELSKSTIGYEIQNYSRKDGVYDAELAQWSAEQKASKKNQDRRKHNNKELLSLIDKELQKKQSPKHIAFLFKERYADQKQYQISHETIYKLAYSYAKLLGDICCDWHKCLPRKRRKRPFRGGLCNKVKKAVWRSIHTMKEGVKKSFGVWQIDTMHLKNGYVFVAVETVSKKVMAKLIYDLRAETIQKACRFLFSRVEDITAIICDRGSENRGFKDLQRMLHTVVYSCDPRRPDQKGLVEQTNGLIRRYLPLDMDARLLSQKDIYKIAAALNNMRRVSLNGWTAREVYACPNLRLK